MNKKGKARINVGFHEKSSLLKRWKIRWTKGGWHPRFWWYRLRWNYCPKLNIVPEFPLHLIIEMTNACNLKCIHCSRPVKFDNKMIEFDLVKEYIDEAAMYKTPSLLLSYGGEVFLYKDLVRALEYVSSKKVFQEITIVTNATLMDQEKANALLKTDLTQLVISVDAFSKEKYEMIRQGANYDKTMNNILYLLRLKKELKRKSPIVRIQMVGMNINQDEIEPFIEFWEPKVDMVTVNDYIHSPDSKEDYSIDGKYTDQSNRQKSNTPCSQLWQRLAITANKSLSLCNNDYNVGEKGNRSIYDWWHSEELNRIRKNHSNGNLDNLEKCRECPFRYL